MDFKFAQMTDTHLYAESSNVSREVRDAFMKKAIKQCAAHNIDFIVNTGDLLTSGNVDDYIHFKSFVDQYCRELGITYYYVRGNHDCMITDEQFRSVFGKSTYWFEHKGWAFVAIDRYYKTYEHTKHAYCLSYEAFDELKNIIEEIPEGMPLIAMLHDDPIGISRFHRGIEMLRCLQQRDIKLLLFGHVQGSYTGRFEEIPFVTVSGEDRPHDPSPLSYNIVSCHDQKSATCDFYPYTVNLPVFTDASSLKMGGHVKPGRDWLNLRGENDNRSINVRLSNHAPVLAWKTQLPGPVGMGGLTLKDGNLFAGTLTKGRAEQCGIFALDGVSGKIKWRKPADGSVEGGVVIHENYGFSGTSAGTVYCFDLKDGHSIWNWNNHDNMPIVCQPVIDENILHCGANWEMYGVNVKTGETVWRNTATLNGFTYMGPGNSSPLILNDRVYHQRPFNGTEESQGLVQTVLKRNGRDLVVYREDVHMHPLFRHASPVRWNEKVVAVGNGLMVIDPEEPKRPSLYISHSEDPSSATPAIFQDIAYVSYHKEIVAYDLKNNGKILWRTSHNMAKLYFSGNWQAKWGNCGQPYGAFSAPLATENCLIVCDCGGNCRCLSKDSGAEIWSVRVEGAVLAAPVISGNSLFIADYNGNVYAFVFPDDI